MKQLTPQMREHIRAEVSTLATCWRLTRRDGVEMFLTDHDEDIGFQGEVYLSRLGFNRTAVESKLSLEIANLELIGVVDASLVSIEDVEAGRLDFAEMRVFLVNWMDPNGHGPIDLRYGTLGEVRTSDAGLFVAELRGITQPYNQVQGEVTTPECRAQLGDHRCKVDLANHQWEGVVESVGTRAIFSVADAPVADFNDGLCKFLSGVNEGKTLEISTLLGEWVTLKFPAPLPIEPGDMVRLVQGCDRRPTTCKDRYNNILNGVVAHQEIATWGGAQRGCSAEIVNLHIPKYF